MTANNVQHLTTGAHYNHQDIEQLLNLAEKLQAMSLLEQKSLLPGKQLAMIFDKPSLRTRFSFTAAMRQLGGDVIETTSSTRKSETPADQMQVLQGYCDAVMIRTHADWILEEMVQVAGVPVINGLTAMHHPCQILADLLTLKAHFKTLQGLTVAYIGDGNNILHSLLLMATQAGVNVHYCCPKTHLPDAGIIEQAKAVAGASTIQAFETAEQAVAGADAVYTDVWTSMGFEEQSLEAFQTMQVNEILMDKAKPGAVFMHCMPMNRGEEVSETLPDSERSLIFKQSENRLHIQKAILFKLMNSGELS